METCLVVPLRGEGAGREPPAARSAEAFLATCRALSQRSAQSRQHTLPRSTSRAGGLPTSGSRRCRLKCRLTPLGARRTAPKRANTRTQSSASQGQLSGLIIT